jgi:MFS family permease
MVSGAATAALVEFDPARDRRRAAMFAGLAQAGGSAAGPLVAGVLAQWAPEPLRLAFVVGVGATAACAVLTLTLPRDRPHADPWRLQLPRVPRAIRGDFARVSLTAATAWAAVALLLSIVPSYARELLDTHNLALLGTLGAVALAASCVTQVVAERRRPQRQVSQALGLAVLAAGLLAIVSASPLHSLALLLVGSVAAGAGHGVAFLNAQEELNELAPEERRGEVTAAFIACIYMLVASAVIATGLLDVELSLSLSVDVVACALVAVAGAAAAWQLRRRSA